MADTLGDTVREARLSLGLGVRALAHELKVSPSYVSDIENDRRVPSEEVLRVLSDRLALDFDELMALAGRFGDEADRYMRRTPAVGALFRELSQTKPPIDMIEDFRKRIQESAKPE